MGANRLPHFRFYPQDYLGDMAVAAMSAEAEGCYIRMLARSWMTESPGVVPEAAVPDMASLHRVDVDRRPRVLAELAAAFYVSEGIWVQKRMVAEHKWSKNMVRIAERAGRKSASMRKMSTDVQRPFQRPSNHREVEVEVDRDKENQTPKPTDATRAKPEPEPDLPDWLPEASWKQWVGHRRGFGKSAPWTPGAARASVRRLQALREQGHDPASVIEESILRGWRGLFPPRPASDPGRPAPELDRTASLNAMLERMKRKEAEK